VKLQLVAPPPRQHSLAANGPEKLSRVLAVESESPEMFAASSTPCAESRATRVGCPWVSLEISTPNSNAGTCRSGVAAHVSPTHTLRQLVGWEDLDTGNARTVAVATAKRRQGRRSEMWWTSPIEALRASERRRRSLIGTSWARQEEGRGAEEGRRNGEQFRGRELR
jgi:hypothetical protein